MLKLIQIFIVKDLSLWNKNNSILTKENSIFPDAVFLCQFKTKNPVINQTIRSFFTPC